MKRVRAILFGLIFSGLLAGPLLAEGLNRQAEVRVVADRMEAESLSNKVTFFGNVKVRQNDVVIYAQKLTLYYSRGEGQAEKGVERAEFEEDVRIVQQDRMATADKGLFLNLERKIIMSGHAEVHQAGNIVKGDEIIYFIDEDRCIVNCAPDSRVKAVINSKGDDR